MSWLVEGQWKDVLMCDWWASEENCIPAVSLLLSSAKPGNTWKTISCISDLLTWCRWCRLANINVALAMCFCTFSVSQWASTDKAATHTSVRDSVDPHMGPDLVRHYWGRGPESETKSVLGAQRPTCDINTDSVDMFHTEVITDEVTLHTITSFYKT